MRLLLDTRVFIWLLKGDPSVGPASTALVQDPNNEVFLSAAAVWEAVIKQALGKLHFPGPAATYLPQKRAQLQIASLAIGEADFRTTIGIRLTV